MLPLKLTQYGSFSEIVVGFSSVEYTAYERDGHATVCVQVLNSPSEGALRPFSVSLLPEEGNLLFIDHVHVLKILCYVL